MIYKKQFQYLTTNTLILTVLLFCFTFFAFSPGVMSSDSFSQYNQALNMSFTDHHPPMMSIWWAMMTFVYKSPSTMLFFHLSMLWLGLYFLASKFKNNYILLIGILPFIINYAGVLWKDVGLAFSWLLAISIFLSVKNINLKRILFLIFMFYGVAVRPNALLALLPILIYFYSIEYHTKLLKSIFLSIITLIVFISVNNIISYTIFNTEKRYAGPKIVMIHDLSGISKFTKNNYFSESVNQKYNVNNIIKKYTPKNVNDIMFHGEKFNYTNMDLADLFTSWKNAIYENPKLYLRLRWENFKGLLRIGNTHRVYYWPSTNSPNTSKGYKALNITYTENILNKILHTWSYIFKTTFLFTGWFWLLGSVILLLLWKKNRLSSVLGLSSILYILPYAMIGQASDFRYIYLSIILVLLGFLTLFYKIDKNKDEYNVQ